MKMGEMGGRREEERAEDELRLRRNETGPGACHSAIYGRSVLRQFFFCYLAVFRV